MAWITDHTRISGMRVATGITKPTNVTNNTNIKVKARGTRIGGSNKD